MQNAFGESGRLLPKSEEDEWASERMEKGDESKVATKSDEGTSDVAQKKQYERFEQKDESRDLYVHGTRIRQHVVDTIKVKDGQQIPLCKREFSCSPPCDVKTLGEYINFKETDG